jgi:lipid-binding SYLF domain-containing protein
MGGTSLGFQAGVQDAELVLMVMTEKGLQAVLDDQVKFGADASLAIATIGAGVQGATTGALGADIVAFSLTRGLFGGLSLGGSLMFQRSRANGSYYGHEMGSRQIVVDMQGTNPGADPLREVLTRYGSSEQQQASAAASGTQSAAPAPGLPTQPSSGPRAVQQQSLTPPR